MSCPLPTRPLVAALATFAVTLAVLTLPARPSVPVQLPVEPALNRPHTTAQPTDARMPAPGPVRRMPSQKVDVPTAGSSVVSQAFSNGHQAVGQDGWLMGMGMLSVCLIVAYWVQQQFTSAIKPVAAAAHWDEADPRRRQSSRHGPVAIMFQSGNRGGGGGKGGGKGRGRRSGGVNVQALNDRTKRLNSLLREVLSDIIRKDVKNPRVSIHTTIMEVRITNDLAHCKVWVSVLGSDKERQDTMQALTVAAPFIRSRVAKMVRMRRHPILYFKLDDSCDREERLEEIFQRIRDGKPAELPEEYRGGPNETVGHPLELEEDGGAFEFDDELWGDGEGEGLEEDEEEEEGDDSEDEAMRPPAQVAEVKEPVELRPRPVRR
eukprot:EG_transcript_5662